MPEININTTQNVPINFQIATIGHRIGAYCVDLGIKIAYILFIHNFVIANMGIDGFTMDDWSIMSIYIVLYLPVTFYSIVQETTMEGQTFGKKLLSIRVVKMDGYQASFIDFLTRWVFRIIDISLSFCVIGGFAASVSKIHQRLGDIAAGTAVIQLKSDVNISHTILEEIKEDYQPKYPEVVRFSDNDMRIIKETYIIARKNNDVVMISKLVRKIEEVSGIKADMEELRFISTVIRDYNFYTGEI
jgi:uncharacterized RDD family membrane protein YckC